MRNIVAAVGIVFLAGTTDVPAYDLNTFRVQGNVFNVTVYKRQVGWQLVTAESYVNVAAFTSAMDRFTVQTLCLPGIDADCEDIQGLLRCNPAEQFFQSPGDTPPTGYYLYHCPGASVDNGACVFISGKSYAAPSGVIPPGTSNVLELWVLHILDDNSCTNK